MRPSALIYRRPESMEEAVAELGAAGEGARVLAGGQSLVPLLNRRLVNPSALVDLGWVAGLRGIRRVDAGLRIGSMTRHGDLERLADPGIRRDFLVLPEAAALIGQPPVRLRGTLGGTLAHADPAAEWCVLAVLLDAEVVARGQAGRRTIPASELFTGGHSTGLLDDEIIEEVRFPGPAATAVLQKFSAQRHGATIMVAAARVETDGSGRVRAAAIALGGVEDRPVRLPNAERSLVGLAPDATVLQDLTTAMAGQIRPTGPPGCRRDRAELAAVLAARAVRASLSRDVQTRAVASKDEDDSRIT